MPVLERLRLRFNRLSNRLGSVPVLVLMPHSRCNCRCVMCDIWRANQAGKELSAADLEPHLDDIKRLRVRWIVLSGGEALMHSNLWQLCESLRGLGARLTLLTTGLLLEKHAAQVAEWIDEVIVSLDGSPEIHDLIRNVPRAYDRLATGVAAVRSRGPHLAIRARCVLQRQNHADFANIIATARSLDLDSISFLAADVSSEAFNRAGGWPAERGAQVALTPEEADLLETVMRESFSTMAGEFESRFVAESPAALLHIVQYFRALNGMADFPPVQCNAPWVSAVIEADGLVRPCFFHAPYGSLRQAGLGELLNSETALAFRRQLDLQQDPVCRKCVCTLNFKA